MMLACDLREIYDMFTVNGIDFDGWINLNQIVIVILCLAVLQDLLFYLSGLLWQVVELPYSNV